MCALLTDGVKQGQMHPMEGNYNHFWQTWPLHSVVHGPQPFLHYMSYFNSNLSKIAGGCVPLSIGTTLIKKGYNNLPLGASDHVWHHPSVVHTYFPLIMECREPPGCLVGSVTCATLGTLEALQYIIRGNMCALLMVGVKPDQMHPMEGLYNHSWQMWRLHSVVHAPSHFWQIFELITHIVQNGWGPCTTECRDHVCQEWL